MDRRQDHPRFFLGLHLVGRLHKKQSAVQLPAGTVVPSLDRRSSSHQPLQTSLTAGRGRWRRSYTRLCLGVSSASGVGGGSWRCGWTVRSLSEGFCFQFAGKYGNIFSLRIFGGRVVVLNGYKTVREALVEKGEDFIDRPSIPLFEAISENKGVVVGTGLTGWQSRCWGSFTQCFFFLCPS